MSVTGDVEGVKPPNHGQFSFFRNEKKKFFLRSVRKNFYTPPNVRCRRPPLQINIFLLRSNDTAVYGYFTTHKRTVYGVVLLGEGEE